MAKQAASFETAGSWAFGPGSNRGNGATSNGGNRARSLPARKSPVEAGRDDYGQPAVFLADNYAQPAVFVAEVDEAPPAERHVWDQLPAERRRRGRRYVGRHRA
jgi:hypothetical protein